MYIRRVHIAVAAALLAITASLPIGGCAARPSSPRTGRVGTESQPSTASQPAESLGASASVAASSEALPPMLPTKKPPSTSPLRAVVGYLDAIRLGYFRLGSSGIVPYVTYEQWNREDGYIQLNATRKEALEMELLSFEVLERDSESATASSATVVSREKWRYRTWDLKAKQPKTDWSVEEFVVRYSVVKQSGGWIVAGKNLMQGSSGTESSETTQP